MRDFDLTYLDSIDSAIEFYNEKPFSVDMWYNRSVKSWVIQVKDDENCQIGDSVYVHSKPEALNQVKYWTEKYGIPLIRTWITRSNYIFNGSRKE